MRKTLIALTALVYAGCAPLFAGSALETGSTLLSLGSLGQTVVQITNMGSGDKKLAVAYLPRQYRDDADRMVRETWEQNFQLVKTAQWEEEDMSWQELAAAVVRKARGNKAVLAMVEKRALRAKTVREEITVYVTPSGKVLRDPMESPGEAFFPQTRQAEFTVPVYVYKAFYFTKSRQPSGILAAEGPWDGPCRTAYGYGALVRAVGKKTPADAARLYPGDIITTVNGRRAEYQNLFALLRPGENTLSICRNGQHSVAALHLPEAAGDSRPAR